MVKLVSMLVEKNIFYEVEFFRIVVKDKIMKVLYEVSLIFEDISEINLIKVVNDGEVK